MIAFLGDHPGLLAHGHAMELGAGPGAVGLALAAAGLVNAVTLTDLEAVLPLTRANVEFASKQSAEVAAMVRSGRLATRSLCWCVGCDRGQLGVTSSSFVGRGDRGERSGDSSPRPSAILCSDCLYDAAQFAPLLSTLLELTEHSRRQGGKEAPLVLVAYKQRLPAYVPEMQCCDEGSEQMADPTLMRRKERAFFVDASQHFDVEVYASTSSGGLVRFVDDDIFICKLRRKRLSDGGLPYADQPAKEAGNNDTK